MKKTKAVLLGVILWSLLLISGCNFIRIEEEPRKPLEYSIVKNEEIPAELAALIQEKKKNFILLSRHALIILIIYLWPIPWRMRLKR